MAASASPDNPYAERVIPASKKEVYLNEYAICRCAGAPVRFIGGVSAQAHPLALVI
jgi:hypothetical protein